MNKKLDLLKTEAYISKRNVYGNALFVMVDHENCLYSFGVTTSCAISPYRANYIMGENLTQKFIKELRDKYVARGYVEAEV